MWLIILSDQLPIVALVGRYPANKLMGRGLIPMRKLTYRGLLSTHDEMDSYTVLAGLSSRYPEHKGRSSTRYSPVRRSTQGPKPPFSHDLHVLSTPPAFNLSQDQTLQFEILVLAETQIDQKSNWVCLIQNHPTRYLLVKDPLRELFVGGQPT